VLAGVCTPIPSCLVNLETLRARRSAPLAAAIAARRANVEALQAKTNAERESVQYRPSKLGTGCVDVQREVYYDQLEIDRIHPHIHDAMQKKSEAPGRRFRLLK
jgi:hypothetical protein